jgi:nucleoside-diphosphate-sugar epimerase
MVAHALEGHCGISTSAFPMFLTLPFHHRFSIAKMPTAIVTGATGMTGHAIVKALAADPSWTKVYALSRSQKGQDHKNIVHATLDLQSSAKDMAKQLSGVEQIVSFSALTWQKTTKERLRK